MRHLTLAPLDGAASPSVGMERRSTEGDRGLRQKADEYDEAPGMASYLDS